jgi:putative ABC transport system permease protein
MNIERLASRIYLLLLNAFPRRHRQSYASEMVDAFEQELAMRMRAGNRLTAFRFVFAAWLNAVVAGFGERRRHQQAGHMSKSFLSSLDVILAWRMLLRYPGLSIISVFSMAVGIAIAGGAYIIVNVTMNAALPLPESDRIVSLMNWDASTTNHERRLLADFESWRGMTSLEDVAISRSVERNLIVDQLVPATVEVAEMSSAAFRVARVPALRGRTLLPEDDRPGAPDVMVIGHDEWLQRFHADPDVVGRSVRLGSTAYTIVGVMPEGFALPVSHSLWIPWRLDASQFAPRTGPVVNIFARLAPGATLASAQAELDAIAQRAAVASPATHQHLRARVMPYAYAYSEMDDPMNALALRAIQFAVSLLLVVVCVNVAILVYARTATRQGEIAVRGALGASRRRIVGQLFVEALLLSGMSAALGIALLAFSLRQINASILSMAGRLPFWMSLEMSADGLVYIVALAMLAAAIVGVVPALKATGQVHTGLQGLSPGSGSRMQMGRLWTLLIVMQVALTVALLPTAMSQAWMSLRFRTGDAGFASHEFLTARIVLDRASTAASSDAGEREFRIRYAAAYAELERRLSDQSAVNAVTFSEVSPGDELAVVVEVEGQPPPLEPVNYNIVEGTKQGHLVRFNRVATNFFDVCDVPMLMGRGLVAADARTDGSPTVIVNKAMADTLFGGASPLGHRIRYVGRSREAPARDVVLDRWYEVVGVAPDFPTIMTMDVERVSRVYHAATPGDLYPVMLAVRVRGNEPSAFANTFREITTAVNPDLQVQDLATADDAMKREQGFMRQVGLVLILVMLSVVVLSAAGIYALMSFTVARRRREIGIRAALGADPTRVLAGIFARALGQLGLGTAVGLAGAFAVDSIIEGAMFQGQGVVIVPSVILFMITVGLLAAIGPARHGLRIQPTEALREE